jgi:cell division protein FtsB
MDTVAALTKVIQEQQKEIEKLESNIKQLESNNASTASQNLDVTDIAFKSIVMILFIALFIKINKTKRGIKHG